MQTKVDVSGPTGSNHCAVRCKAIESLGNAWTDRCLHVLIVPVSSICAEQRLGVGDFIADVVQHSSYSSHKLITVQ